MDRSPKIALPFGGAVKIKLIAVSIFDNRQQSE